MPVSSVDIANLALAKLGAGRIENLNEDSDAARICNLLYDQCRSEILTGYNWSFALRRQALPALVTPPAFGFNYAYEMPTGCLRLLQVGETYPPHDYSISVQCRNNLYEVENNQILTDLEAPLKIYFVYDVTDTTQFSRPFVNYLATKIAFEACETLTQSNTKKQVLASELKIATNTAIAIDRTQNPPQSLQDGSWVDSRVSYLGGGWV